MDAFTVLTLLVGQQEGRPAFKKYSHSVPGYHDVMVAALHIVTGGLLP